MKSLQRLELAEALKQLLVEITGRGETTCYFNDDQLIRCGTRVDMSPENSVLSESWLGLSFDVQDDESVIWSAHPYLADSFKGELIEAIEGAENQLVRCLTRLAVMKNRARHVGARRTSAE